MSDLGKTTTWFLMNNKKRYINMLAAVTVGLFLIFAAKTGMFGGYGNGLIPQEYSNTVPIITFVFIAFTIFVGGNICKDIKTKQQRTLYMMLPATHARKFWTRILISALLIFVAFPLSIVSADLLQMLISLIFTGDATSMTALLLNFSDPAYEGVTGLTATLYAVSFITMAAWGTSSYILGGFLFRKIPILLTTLVWIVMWIAIVVTSIKIGSNVIEQYEYIEVDFIMDKNIALSLLSIFAGTLFTVVNLWLSYRVHKRMSIVSNKWLNI